MSTMKKEVEELGIESRHNTSTKRNYLDALYNAIHRLRPFRRTLRLLYRFTPTLPKNCVRWCYEAVSLLDKHSIMKFMNYGYASLHPDDPGLELRGEDAGDRYCIQLYQRVASALDLGGKDVLEVGCGRGGGASFVRRYFGPRSMTGLDFAHKAVAFCRSHYQLDGLSFVQGDAEDLPFPAGSFDAVLNVESSCHYHSMERFLQEVKRVLRPHGYLLFADLRSPIDVEVLLEQFQQSGLVTISEERITANVLRSLELDSERRLALLRNKVPRILLPLVKDFAGVKGTKVYESFRMGECEYYHFVLRKSG